MVRRPSNTTPLHGLWYLLPIAATALTATILVPWSASADDRERTQAVLDDYRAVLELKARLSIEGVGYQNELRFHRSAARSAAEELDNSPSSPTHLVYRYPEGSTGVELAVIDHCLDGVVAYRIAALDYPVAEAGAPYALPVDTESYATEIMASIIPDVDPHWPGVDLAFHHSERDWHFALRNWDDVPELEARIASNLADYQSPPDSDYEIGTAEHICRVADIVNAEASSDEDDIERRSRQRGFDYRRQAMDSDIDTSIEEIEANIPRWLDPQNTDPGRDITRLRDSSRSALSDVSPRTDQEHVELSLGEAADALQELRRYADAARAAGKAHSHLRREVLSRRGESRGLPVLRDLPFYADTLEASHTTLEELEDSMDSGDPLEEIELHTGEAREAIEELDTAGRQLTLIKQIGLGLVALLLLAVSSRVVRLISGNGPFVEHVSRIQIEWMERLEDIETDVRRLHSLLREYRGEESNPPLVEVLDDDERETIDLVFALIERAREVADELNAISIDSQRDSGDAQEAIDEICQQVVALTPRNTEDSAVVGDRLREDYEYAASELLDELELRLDAATSIAHRLEGDDANIGA